MVTAGNPQYPETLVHGIWFACGGMNKCRTEANWWYRLPSPVVITYSLRLIGASHRDSGIGSGKDNPPDFHLEGGAFSLMGEERTGVSWQSVGTIRMDATSRFAKNTGRFQLGLNYSYVLRVRVHVLFSNTMIFPVSILGSLWNVNEEVCPFIKAPPNQVTRVSGFQLCHGTRHLQVKDHLRLWGCFKRLTKFLSEDLEFHRGQGFDNGW